MKAIRTLSPEDVAAAFAKDSRAAAAELLEAMKGKPLPEELLVAACAAHPEFVYALREQSADGFKAWDAACSADPYMLDASPSEIQTELAAQIVARNSLYLDALPYELRTKNVCMEAVKRDGDALEFVPTHFRDKELCKAACDSKPSAFKHFPRTFWDEFSEAGNDGIISWHTPEWVEKARAEHPEIDEWLPEMVLAYQPPVKAAEAPKQIVKTDSPIEYALAKRGMIGISNSASSPEGRALAPDKPINLTFGGRKFPSIEAAYSTSLKAFPEMAKDELKLLSTIYLKASEADSSIKDALASLGDKEVFPAMSYSDKTRHPANPFLIAAAIDRVRAHYGFKTPPIPYCLDGSPFESPFKPGYLYDRDEAARKYARWLSASIRARVSRQGMEDVAKIVALASSGMKVCIHSQFPEAAKAFAKAIGSLCEKAKTAKDLEEAIGEPCPPEAAYIKHKSIEEARAEKRSARAFEAHPRSRIVRFTPETYILAMPGTRIYGTEKVSLDEMKALLAERKDWKIVFGLAPVPVKIVLDIDGRILPGAKEVSFDNAKSSLKLARPTLQYDGSKLKRPMTAGSIEEMERRAKSYPNAKLLQWDAKAIDTAILVLDGSEAGKTESISFRELQREATKETGLFICSTSGSIRRAVKSIDDIEREMKLHPHAALCAYKSLAPTPLKDFEEFERLWKCLPEAAILRRPASVRAQIVRDRQMGEDEGEPSLLSRLAPAIAAVKGAGVRDLKKAAHALMEKVESNNIDGLTASEARHAAGKIAALDVIKEFQTRTASGKEICVEHLIALGKALDKFGVDGGQDLYPDEFPISHLRDEVAAVARELNWGGFSLPGAETKAAKGIIKALKAEAIMQVQADWREDALRESYNDSLDLETEQTVMMRVPKANVDGFLRGGQSLSEKGEDGDMAIFEASYLMPDRDALTDDDLEDETENQYYGADAIRAMDMPLSQIEREAKSVFSIANPFMPEPSFITALEQSESMDELQERHDFEDQEPSVAPTFIHFDEQEPSSSSPGMHR